MAWRLLGDKPLSEPMVVSLLTHICVTRPQWINWTTGIIFRWNCIKIQTFSLNKIYLKMVVTLFIWPIFFFKQLLIHTTLLDDIKSEINFEEKMCNNVVSIVPADVSTLLTHLPPGQNGRHFADDIFRCIFMYEKFWILIRISFKSVPKGPIDNNPALVWIMDWHWIGDKPLAEPMLTWFTDAYILVVTCDSFLSCSIILKFCAEHMLHAKFQNDWST